MYMFLTKLMQFFFPDMHSYKLIKGHKDVDKVSTREWEDTISFIVLHPCSKIGWFQQCVCSLLNVLCRHHISFAVLRHAYV